MKLADYIGQEIYGLIPALGGANSVVPYMLRGVEAGGIWIEHRQVTETVLGQLKLSAAPKTALLFVPYAQIRFLLGFGDFPSFSEASFGLDTPET